MKHTKYLVSLLFVFSTVSVFPDEKNYMQRVKPQSYIEELKAKLSKAAQDFSYDVEQLVANITQKKMSKKEEQQELDKLKISVSKFTAYAKANRTLIDIFKKNKSANLNDESIRKETVQYIKDALSDGKTLKSQINDLFNAKGSSISFRKELSQLRDTVFHTIEQLELMQKEVDNRS